MSVEAASAVERLADPFLIGATTADAESSAAPDIEIESLILSGVKLDYQIAEAVTDATLERTIEGASTLTIVLLDDGPEHKLMRSGIFALGANVKIDTLNFELVKIEKQGDELTITCEDLAVAWLRQFQKPIKAYRDTTTRAEFVLRMVREANKKYRFGWVIPELHVKERIRGDHRPVRSHRDRPSPRASRNQRAKGLDAHDNLPMKGVRATPYQLHQAERALTVADGLNAPDRAVIAMLCAGIGESSFRAVPNSAGSGYAGVFQANPRNIPMEDTEQQARCFLLGGKGFQAGGAIHLAKQGLDAGTIATKVEASGEPGNFYGIYDGEARNILEAYGGVDGSPSRSSDGGSRTVTRVKRYAFTRGDQGKAETSWTAIQRLADEVGWRAFMVANKFYFVSEEYLFKSKPRMRLSEDSPGVDTIDFSFDLGKKTAEATVACHATRWIAPPGTVVAIENMGDRIDGKWLVKTIERGLYDRAATITLGKPIKAKPEPAPETTTDTVSGHGRRDSVGGGRGNYVNPLPGFTFAGVDMGTDWSGGGNILAIGDAVITRAAPQNSGTGWPGAGDGGHGNRGAMVVYRLLGGPRRGKHVYLAENIDPKVKQGQRVKAGDAVAHARGQFPYLEMGWAMDDHGTPEAHGHADQVTSAGQNFRDFLKTLGAS